jgi:hypothetical protein
MAKKSQRTKDVAKLARLFFILSCLCFLGVAIFSVVAIFSRVGGSEKQGMEIISEQLKTLLISTSITTLIIAIAALFIKEKLRYTIYMLSLIVIGILYKEVGAYITLGVFAVDEFILHNLYLHYKQLKTINKEIDRRG